MQRSPSTPSASFEEILTNDLASIVNYWTDADKEKSLNTAKGVLVWLRARGVINNG